MILMIKDLVDRVFGNCKDALLSCSKPISHSWMMPKGQGRRNSSAINLQVSAHMHMLSVPISPKAS